MINFSLISRNSLLGRILRVSLKLIPAGTVVPILQGRLRGKRWIKGAGVNSYWLGTYEVEKQEIFEEKIKPGDVVFDIGAHVGFFTLLASELVGKTGRVTAFEPLPRNVGYLKKHVELNECRQVKVVAGVVSDKNGPVFFKEAETSSEGGIDSRGELKVQSTTLDEYVVEQDLPLPRLIKIDAEGAETLVLKGGRGILAKHHPIIVLSIHSKENRFACLELLESLQYHLEAIDGEDIQDSNEILAQ